jgi:hypothetical protein
MNKFAILIERLSEIGRKLKRHNKLRLTLWHSGMTPLFPPGRVVAFDPSNEDRGPGAFLIEQKALRKFLAAQGVRSVNHVFKADRQRGIMGGASSFSADARRGACNRPELVSDGDEPGAWAGVSPSWSRRLDAAPASGRATAPRSDAPGGC